MTSMHAAATVGAPSFAGETPDDGRIRARQIGVLSQRTPVIAVTNLINSALTIVVFWGLVAEALLLSWFAFLWIAVGWQLIRWLFNRNRVFPPTASSRGITRATIWAAVMGGAWGLAGFAFLLSNDIVHGVYLAFVIGGMAAGAVASLSPVLPACVVFIVASVGPLVAGFLVQGEGMSLVMAAMMGIFLSALLYIAKMGNASFFETVRAALENERLLGKLTEAYDHLETRVAERTRELRESEQRFQDFAEASADWFWEMDADRRFTYMSPAVQRILGVAPERYYGKTRQEILGESNLDSGWKQHLRGLDDRQPFRDFIYYRVGEDMKGRWLSASGVPVFDEAGGFQGYRGTGSDVSAAIEAREALRMSEEQLRLITDSLPMLIAYVDREQCLCFVNATYERWFASPREAIIGKSLQEVSPIYDRLEPYVHEALTGREVSFEEVVTYSDGKTRDVRVLYLPHTSGDGSVRGFVSVVENVTERRAMEAQLRQAQKMEAVGQLTGGVAHDFNNLLTAILGNLQMLKEDIEGTPDVQASLEIATKATRRGGELTQRLLAFSRQQALNPTVVDVNELVPSVTEDLLRRVIGEDIAIATELAPDLWRAVVDRAQLEAALLNLAVNARDAMPNGGKLVIETANVRLDDDYAAQHDEVSPGAYVMIAVSDTGEGMTPDVMARAFEPFFTTKEVGQGSGLGLSMVYGFVKQSEGHASVYSEVGRGTTMKLFLPRAQAGHATQQKASEQSSLPLPVGHETILVVEDDRYVRRFVVTVLERLGYTVLQAEDGPSALSLLDEQAAEIDLLLTDVVLPRGMTGAQIVERLGERFPHVRALFMSGYTENAVIHQMGTDGGIELLSKPFTREALARTVRQTLDRSAA